MEGALAQMQGWGITVMRMVGGIIFLVHGSQKLFVMGIGGVAGFFEQLGIPAPMLAAIVVTLVEFVGGAALILGLFTRWVAIPLAIDMLVATFVVHLPNGFIAIPNGGYEFTLLLMAASISLVLAGVGALSLDNLLARRGMDAGLPLRRFGRREPRTAGFTAETREPDDER